MLASNVEQFRLAIRSAKPRGVDRLARLAEALTRPKAHSVVFEGRRYLTSRVLELWEGLVAKMYEKATGLFGIDWQKVIDWLKENWVEILKLLLTVMIFLI